MNLNEQNQQLDFTYLSNLQIVPPRIKGYYSRKDLLWNESLYPKEFGPPGQIWLMHALTVEINFTFSEYGLSRKTFKWIQR